jgi:acyl-CoA reductase-like NAD-dependent aldehyde dehydrogenase
LHSRSPVDGAVLASLRRLFVHDSIYGIPVPRLKKIYSSLPIGNPRRPAYCSL